MSKLADVIEKADDFTPCMFHSTRNGAYRTAKGSPLCGECADMEHKFHPGSVTTKDGKKVTEPISNILRDKFKKGKSPAADGLNYANARFSHGGGKYALTSRQGDKIAGNQTHVIRRNGKQVGDLVSWFGANPEHHAYCTECPNAQFGSSNDPKALARRIAEHFESAHGKMGKSLADVADDAVEMLKDGGLIEKAGGPRFKVGDYVKSKAHNVGAGNLGGVHGRILATRENPTLGTMHEVEWSHGASDSSGAVSAKAWRREMALDAGTKDEFERQRGKGLAKADKGGLTCAECGGHASGAYCKRHADIDEDEHLFSPSVPKGTKCAECGAPAAIAWCQRHGGPKNVKKRRCFRNLADVVSEAEWRGRVETEIVAKADKAVFIKFHTRPSGAVHVYAHGGDPSNAMHIGTIHPRSAAGEGLTGQGMDAEKATHWFVPNTQSGEITENGSFHPNLKAALDHASNIGRKAYRERRARESAFTKAAEPAVAGKDDPATKRGRPPARTGGSKPGQVVHRSQTGYEVIASGREHPIPGGQHFEVHPVGRKQKVGEIYANPIGRAGETGIHLQPVAISHDGVNLGEHDGFDAAVQAIASNYETAEGAKRAGSAAKQANDAVTGRVRTALGGAGKTDSKPTKGADKSKPASKAKPMKKLADVVKGSGGHKCGGCAGAGRFRGRKCAICNGTGYHMPSQGHSAQDCYCGKPSEGRDVPVSKAKGRVTRMTGHMHRYDHFDCGKVESKCSNYAHAHCSDCGTSIDAEGGGGDDGRGIGGYDGVSCNKCKALLCHGCAKRPRYIKKLADVVEADQGREIEPNVMEETHA